MSEAPSPAPKPTGPIGAYRTYNGFAAYDAMGRAWPVDQAKAEALGIKDALTNGGVA